MGTTTFSGPVKTGPNKDSGDTAAPYNQGYVVLSQSANITFNATLVSESEIWIPPGAQIVDIIVDTLTAFNSATSATFTAGITSGATTYAGSVDCKTAARVRPTFTGAQLAAMSNQSVLGVAALTPGPVFLTITSVGQPTAGYVTVDVIYVQLPAAGE